MKLQFTHILFLASLFSSLGISLVRAQSPTPQTLVTDTLVPGGLRTGDSFCDNLVINCLRPDCRKGYVTGNNRYGMREVLMKYRFSEADSRVVSAFINLGRKVQANASSPTYAVMYSVGVDGYPDSTTRTLSNPITMSRLRDGVYQQYTFTNSIAFQDSFFVGFVLPATAGDTIGVFQTKNRNANPCATARDTLAYERYADGRFARAYDTWGVVFELGIMVKVEYTAVAVRNRLASQVQVRPVPASAQVRVSLSGGIGATGWQLSGVDGRLWQQSNSTLNTVANRSWNIARNNAPAGVYLLTLTTAQGPIVKRLVFAD